MAEEDVQYASEVGGTNKRKYEDQTTPSPIPRKPTGFSAPISDGSGAAPAVASYNSVPPPMDDFQLAKQKAQEIAARLLNSAAEPKKARVDNGAPVASPFDSFERKGFELLFFHKTIVCFYFLCKCLLIFCAFN